VAGEDSATAGPGSPRPTIAGVYDYLLGGTDGSTADRALGDQIIASLPDVQVGVRAQRAGWPGRSGTWPPRRVCGLPAPAWPASP